MKLEKMLQEIGLSQKEASVYPALLSLKESGVSEISQEAATKRPTTYLILETLESKGLVGKNTLHKKTVYYAETPEKLLTIVTQQKQLISQVLPQLLQTYSKHIKI